MINFNLRGIDEVVLLAHEYRATNPDAIVIIVHGMADHSMRYDELAKFLQEHHISVYSYDHRGHGESVLENEKHGYLGVDGFNKMVYDLDIMVNYVKAHNPSKKVFILGHSMGSFIVQRYIQRYKKASGIILTGSNYKVKGINFVIVLSKLINIFKGEKSEAKLMESLSFGSYNKQFAPNRTGFDWISSDPNAVDQYVEDNYCGFTCSNRFYLDFLKGLKHIQNVKHIKNANRKTPILILSGEQDPVGKNGEGVKQLYNVYSNHFYDVQMKLYPNKRHEILLEDNKQEIYTEILNWLKSNLNKMNK